MSISFYKALTVVRAKASVFFSYKHIEPDAALAHAFAESLRGKKHEVFIDTGIRWGHSWVSEIEKALKARDYLLLLLSEEAALSGTGLAPVAWTGS